MTAIPVEEAQTKLSQLIDQLASGEEVVIVRDGEPVATLIRTASKRSPCKAGSYRKTEFWMAPDFDAPLEEFKEYME